jgi:hypothetical protein
MSQTATNDTRASAEGDKPLSAKFWLSELEAARKRDEKWHKRGEKVIARYRDERESDDRTERKTNILWSNTEVLKSVLFQGIGNPDVRRRFPRKGKEERAARQASLVLEHGLSYCADSYDASAQIECAVEDMLLPGLGQCWVVYDAEIEEEPASDDSDDSEAAEQVATGISDQQVYFEHVYWQDYRTSAGRKEADIWWKARRHQYSRDELKTYFPKDAEKVPLEASIADRPADSKDDDDTFKRANVWEIWDKTKRQRSYVAEGYDIILRQDDDPYQLQKFFPCPEPLYGVKTTSSLIPIPEYTLYQDQAEELDRITTRLMRLIEALKRRGVYDATLEGADNQLSGLADADDNEFLPYKGFAALQDKGGLKNVFATEDLKPIIEVVNGLFQQRAMLVQTIYEVTGISDVIRGSSDPNETATAQRIKGQFGSLRIQKRQGKVQTFIRDLFRIKGEIIAEHFEREKLEEMTGIDMPLQAQVDQAKQQLSMIEQQQQMAQQAAQQPPQPGVQAMGANGGPPMNGMPAPPLQQQPAMPQPSPEQMAELQQTAKAVSWEEIAAILKSDDRRGYKVDIETDATVNTDEQMEKQNRIEFLGTMQGFLERSIPAVMQMPELGPLIKELGVFTVKSFKVGRTLEEAFDDFFDKVSKRPPPQQQGDPVAEAKAKQIETQTKLSVDKAKGDAQVNQVKTQATVVKAQTDMAKSQFEMESAKEERAFEREERQQDMAADREQRQFDLVAQAQDRQMDQAQRAQDMRQQSASGVMDLQQRRQQMTHADQQARLKAQQRPRGQ